MSNLIASLVTLKNFEIEAATQPSDDSLIVSYRSIDGNRPHTFGNTVALWDVTMPDPEFDHPLTTADIETDANRGSILIKHDLQGIDYLVTYQVGALTTMCAQLRLSLSLTAMSAPPNSITMSVEQLTDTSITLRYDTLGGYLPQTYNNWVGIWSGFPNPFRAGTPAGRAEVPNATEGLVPIPNISIEPTFNYTVVYHMGNSEKGTDVGAALSFTAKQP